MFPWNTYVRTSSTHTLVQLNLCIHPSRPLREPPDIKKFKGADNVLSESFAGSLIGSVVLAGVLDLFDCLFYYWRNCI